MDQRRLGSSGIRVPAVGLGTYRVFHVHNDAGQACCEAVVDAALGEGAAFFDTSPMYGTAEEVLACALGEERDRACVATKVWARDRALGELQVERALAWFGRVDLYQVHNLLAVDEHLRLLRRLKSEGRIGAIGVTHYLASAIPELLALMRAGEVDAVQVPYHPWDRAVERELLPEAARRGVAVIVMMPLASGRLVARQPRAEELEPLAAFGVHTWAQALLKWILSEPCVTTVIPATSSPDHLRENAAAGRPPWFGGAERDYVRRLAEGLT